MRNCSLISATVGRAAPGQYPLNENSLPFPTTTYGQVISCTLSLFLHAAVCTTTEEAIPHQVQGSDHEASHRLCHFFPSSPLNVQNVGERCKAQRVCLDQRTALYKSYLLLLLLLLLSAVYILPTQASETQHALPYSPAIV